jgi:hypothetical protein
MKAYVLIQTESGAEPIAPALRQIPGVVTAEDLKGPYAAIALANSTPMGETVEHTIARIRNLPGVIRVLQAPLNHLSPDRVGVGDEERSDYAAA